MIGHSTLETGPKIIAVPEQTLNAALTLEMTNSTGQALLPGKVALYQDGTFLGVTDVSFIAQGERFSVFLSVADHLKLARTLDKKNSSLVRKKRNKMQVSFIVTVENLSAQPSAVTLADRIPVSENKDIKIDEVRITGAAKPDSKGIVRWALSLRPKEKKQLRIAYQVEYPPELILETRRRHESAHPIGRRPARMENAQAPSPAPSFEPQKSEIGEQLMDLESKF